MHEVLTLQLGQQANYVGTHYWNAQESYFTYEGDESSAVDHDISFRPGVGADGTDTFTPRTLIYDLKGAFGTLRRENALYELQNQPDPTQQGPWGGEAISLRLPPIEQNPYQQALDAGSELPALTSDTVRFWSDYNHVYYHPKSVVQLNDYEVNSSLMPFERYETGEELFANLDREHDLMDRDVRPFLEECDQLQAIQLFSSTDDAWGGFAAKYLERIADELGKGCRWVFAMQDAGHRSRAHHMLRTLNMSQAVSSINQTSSMYLPISSIPSKSPSYFSFDSSSRWHTSALQAAIAESLTLPARLNQAEPAKATYDHLEAAMNRDGQLPIASLALSVENPVALEQKIKGDAGLDGRIANGLTNGRGDDHVPEVDFEFLPEVTNPMSNRGRGQTRTRTLKQVEVLRGSWKTPADIQDSNTASRDRFTQGPRTILHQTALLYPILSSSPGIFSFDGSPGKLALRAVMRTSTDVAQYLQNLAGVARRQMHGVGDREALYEGLMTMAEEYEEALDISDDDEDE